MIGSVVFQHSVTPAAAIDDEDSLPDEACGSIITPAKKSASQPRRAPKIGERSRENEATLSCSWLIRFIVDTDYLNF
jgi:hypothetical protein